MEKTAFDLGVEDAIKEANLKKKMQAAMLAGSMALGGGGAASIGHQLGKKVSKAPISQTVKRMAPAGIAGLVAR